ncbi:MAG: carbon-nitrogen hydrolase [Bacteroidota bacterium]|nr:carbon-nitrogen hydrolase [Candidatus Kapabacteria bacterium]MDW8220978.1 carbon-nitrogen hydrolase [Bacteroidota bacterium]
MQSWKVALVQMRMSSEKALNIERGIGYIEQAAQAGAHMICLPELFASPYFCQREDSQLFDLAENYPHSETVQALQVVAKRTHTVLIVPIFERRAPGIYHNSAVILDSTGEVAGLYRKMHIPDDPAFYEKYYFTPGDLGFKAFDTSVGRIAVLICWDQWYPEGARLAALHGASIIFYPTAIGWHPAEKERYGAAQHDAWRTVQRGHAIANGVYVAAANRVGREVDSVTGSTLEFWGQSFIADPQGVLLAEASAENEEIIYADVDVRHIETIRRNWPFLRDRRIDAYAALTNRFLD